MEISALKLVYDFELKYNALNTGKAKDFRVIDIVSWLNQAIEEITANLVEEEDKNDTIRQHLRPLVIKKHKLTCTKVDNDCCKFSYPDNHYMTSSIVAKACNECCEEPKKIVVNTVQTDDLETNRRNPYRRSNFFFEQLLGDEAHDGYYIYHDCEMEIKEVYIDYIKRVKRIEAASIAGPNGMYKKWDGQGVNQDVNLELFNTYLNNKISDVAVYLASTSTRDIQFNQTKIREIIGLSTIHI